MRNAVATLGTALTMRHIRLLSRHARHRIVYLFDGDAAGQRAADRRVAFIDGSMTPEAGKSRIELAAVTLPDDLDPAEFVGLRGADELKRLVERAQPLLAYGIERRLANHDLSRPEGRAVALTDALSVLAPIKDSMLAKDYAVQIASRCRAREEDVLAELAHLKPPRLATEEDAAPASSAAGGPSFATRGGEGGGPGERAGGAVVGRAQPAALRAPAARPCGAPSRFGARPRRRARPDAVANRYTYSARRRSRGPACPHRHRRRA